MSTNTAQANNKEETTKVVIDAAGRSLGRVASEAAVELLGKKDPHYKPHVVMPVEVHITNASHMNIDPKKLQERRYKSFSGHPGGLKEKSGQEIADKKGYGELLRHAVFGMLPKNKLRKERMKNLTIVE